MQMEDDDAHSYEPRIENPSRLPRNAKQAETVTLVYMGSIMTESNK